MRKNILIFGHGYGPQFVDISNQYTQLFNKQEYAVTVVYLVGKPNEDIKQKHLADDVIFLDSPKKTVRGLKIPIIKKMLALCREKNVEIVICHRYKPSHIMMIIALFQTIPLLFFVMHELKTLSPLTRKLSIAMLARSNMIFAGVSDAVRDDMRRDIWCVPPDRVITLYNMIDIPFTESKQLDRETARLTLNISPTTFLFGTMGRLVKNKDQHSLIQAFSLIKKQCPTAKLMIVGEGILEQALKKQVAQLHLQGDVIFTGFLQDSFRYMKAFDVYISSSIQEAFGRVLLEAMIARIPIIATRVHGVPEVIGDTGPLVPPADPKTLAAAMLEAYQQSTEQRQQWGMRGYQRAQNCFSLACFHTIFWNLPSVLNTHCHEKSLASPLKK